jgi:lysophospholipase L1-like esterase
MWGRLAIGHVSLALICAGAVPDPAARKEIEARIAALKTGIENPGALASVFASLREGDPIHILQFGDFHTSSGEWVSAMRKAAQARYHDGGPGFIQAGRPLTPGWKINRGDPNQGLSGMSISTEAAGQTISLTASGEALEILYLQQPGGGQLELTVDGEGAGTFSTDGDFGSGHSEYSLSAGRHRLSLRTLDAAPVRIFGWTLDNPQGVTVENLGLADGQASSMLRWNEGLWAAALNLRNPSLVILAYGTTEANSRAWTPKQYRAELTAVIARIRRATPAVSILMIGPPDSGLLQPLPHLSEVIEIQREIAQKERVAFWDLRLHMGGPGIIHRWVQAGLAQSDCMHLTAAGYQMVAKMLFDRLERAKYPL